jgi:glycosyltransferase involved in cell wall biosynthesis
LMLLSDHVSSPSGLSRIARDLSFGIHSNLGDIFRFCSIGCGAPDSPQFPWDQYSFNLNVEKDDWIVADLPEIWNDFAGDEPGILAVIWDISRLSWLALPELDESLQTRSILRNFLKKNKFKKYLYCPVDAEGPHERLSWTLSKRLAAFDRVLAYTEFGSRVLGNSLSHLSGKEEVVPNIPHGINTKIFFEKDREWCRKTFLNNTRVFNLMQRPVVPLAKDETLVAIVGTNQSRKDWALGIQTVALLAKDRKIRLWAHIDELERAWSLPTLLVDYGLVDRTVISTGYISDENMAAAYSAADVSLGIAPEGFGFCVAESLAVGTPCVTGSYGGAAEIVEKSGLQTVAPVAHRYEGPWNMYRPVYDPQHWADYANKLIGTRAKLDPQYAWSSLWSRWESWFRDGAK